MQITRQVFVTAVLKQTEFFSSLIQHYKCIPMCHHALPGSLCQSTRSEFQ